MAWEFILATSPLGGLRSPCRSAQGASKGRLHSQAGRPWIGGEVKGQDALLGRGRVLGRILGRAHRRGHGGGASGRGFSEEILAGGQLMPQVGISHRGPGRERSLHLR